MRYDSLVNSVMTREVLQSGIGFHRGTYSPHRPTERQQMFLDLRDEMEVFYGGAAGGGKSDALLMAALEYVHVPGYAAILFRRTHTDLAKPGALMDRSHAWLTGHAHWDGQKKMWTFPGGGRLVFGYLDTENTKFRYQSDEYQFIGFDELTHFTETQYTYMFSRLRRPVDGSLNHVPLRMRAGSNPPQDAGGLWVKRRFVPVWFRPEDAVEPKVIEQEYIDEETGQTKTTKFIPARLDDNPHVDRAAYRKSLGYLDPVTRKQLLEGDWKIQLQGDILFDWKESNVIVPWSSFMRVMRMNTKRVPLHWQLSVFHDWGGTHEHPAVVGWFATAAENTPPVRFRDQDGKLLYEVPLAGSVFWYRTHIRTIKVTAANMKRDIVRHMVPDNEVARCRVWEMSHEALSEREAYNDTDDGTGIHLPFINWQVGKRRGIEQLKAAIAPRYLDQPHPFNPGVWGRPKLFILVDDDQAELADEVLDGHDRGQSRVRAEAPAYKWNTPKSGDIPTKLEPYPLFNDAMDVARGAAASLWPEMEELTAQEALDRAVQKRLLQDGVQEQLRQGTVPEGRQIAEAVVRAQEVRRLQHVYDIDEFGFDKEPEDLTDIGEGW